MYCIFITIRLKFCIHSLRHIYSMYRSVIIRIVRDGGVNCATTSHQQNCERCGLLSNRYVRTYSSHHTRTYEWNHTLLKLHRKVPMQDISCTNYTPPLRQHLRQHDHHLLFLILFYVHLLGDLASDMGNQTRLSAAGTHDIASLVCSDE